MKIKSQNGILLFLGLLIAVAQFSFKTEIKESAAPELKIRDSLLAQTAALDSFIKNNFLPSVDDSTVDEIRLQCQFLQSRLLYKRFEWAAEYFMGATSQLVNGAPVPEVDNVDLQNVPQTYTYAMEPTGFQVIEALLFPHYKKKNRQKLVGLLTDLQANIFTYKSYFSHTPLVRWRILDAAKSEVFRVLTLGITGYDNSIALNGLAESATALESLHNLLSSYHDTDNALLSKMDAAAQYLGKNTDFNTFNRAVFIRNYGNKISAGIAALQEYPVLYNRLLSQRAKTLFDSAAFNVNAFTPEPGDSATDAKILLGKRLFFDPNLSHTKTRSCASCHVPDKAFTDGLAKNKNIHGNGLLDRNTPTLLNAAYQSDFFYDMRAITLEDQAKDVIENQAEMGGSLKNIALRLNADKSYRMLFSTAFPKKEHKTIDTPEITNALAAYVRSLAKLNSRFDKYMRGDDKAMNRKEIKGFNLFMGKAKCATCHFMPLFNGMLPPKFLASEAEIIGVPATADGHKIDGDLGWYNTIKINFYKYAFKTPTIRNAARTAPYMHNGVFSSLKQVMHFYNNGGGSGMGIRVEHQTLPEDSLHLSKKEENELIAFIHTLNSK